MSFVFEQKMGKHTYVFEATAYRDENGKPRNKRTPIGKIDPHTGLRVYKKDYLERMEVDGTPISVPVSPPTFTINNIRASVVKEFGAFYLYTQIAEKIGLASILRIIFGDRWQQIFDLACYLISTGEPLMYYENWLEKTDGYPASLSSASITRLLQIITHQEQECFFEKWSQFRQEQEYLALDITSVSSYSQLIDDIEWGYNRDGEALPQINLCLLLGENSRLPVFQTVYSGSIKDVSTLKSTLSLAFNIGKDHLTLVMDKGFFSTKNVNSMLDGPLKSHFIISLPFTLKFAQAQISGQQVSSIDNLEHTIVLGRDILRGLTKECTWSKNKYKIYTHVYYNVTKAVEARNTLYGYVTKLVELANVDPQDSKHVEEFKKYLTIQKTEATKPGYTINVRRDVIERQLRYTGWLVLISNHTSNAKEALKIYRAKDVVEKGFLRLKRQLDLHRLRIHSDISMRSKFFIGFISLILMSHLHNVMLSEDLYKTFTMSELIRELEKLKVQYIAGSRILYPITAIQKKILQAFNTDIPV